MSLAPTMYDRLAPARERIRVRLAPGSRWTTDRRTGRDEILTVSGLSIRFVPASEATVDPAGLVVPIGDVPDDEAEMAPKLFGVKARGAHAPAARVGWRKQHAARGVVAGQVIDQPPVRRLDPRPGAARPPFARQWRDLDRQTAARHPRA